MRWNGWMKGRRERRLGRCAASAETLEPRRLLSNVTFAAPDSTPLPAGFQVGQLIPALGFSQSNSLAIIATSTSGGGLLLDANSDGSFTVNQHLSTSADILGAQQLTLSVAGVNTNVYAVYTTSGLMRRQSDGTFSAPAGLTLPTDAVPGVYAINEFATFNPDLLIERYTPDSADPSHGTVTLAVFPLQSDGIYKPEKDTVIATSVAGNPLSGQLPSADYNNDRKQDVVALNHIWFGKGDGTFSQGPELTLPAPPAGATVYPFRLTNFVGASDLVVFPAPPAGGAAESDAAQALVAQPDGSFASGGRTDFGPAGSTDGRLLVDDFTADGTTDLVTGVRTGSQPTGVAIAPGVGDGTFLPPSVISTPGFDPLLNVDIDHDGKPDLVGVSSNSGALVTLLNTTPAGPLIEFATSANPTFAGELLTLTAIVTTSNNFNTNITFMDGSAVLGNVPLQSDGRAVFVTNKLSAGSHTLTAALNQFPGGGASSPVTQIVNADPVNAPFVAISDLRLKLPTPAVPGDRGILRVKLANLGGQLASGQMSIHVSATSDASVGGDSIPLSLPGLDGRTLTLGPRHQAVFTTPFVIPSSLPDGSYVITADLQSGGGFSAGTVSSATASSSSFALMRQFGNVGSRRNVKLVRRLDNGDVVTFSLLGSGTGTVTEGTGPLTLGNGGPDFQASVSNTDGNSKLTISQTGSMRPNVVSLTLDNTAFALGTLDVRQDTPHTFTTQGAISKVMIGTTPPAQARLGAFPAPVLSAGVTIGGPVDRFSADSIINGSVSLTDTDVKPTVKIGTLASGFGIQTGAPIASLQVDSADSGSFVHAPAIGKLVSRGDFDADLTVTGFTTLATALGSATIGGSIVGGVPRAARWAINGNIGKVRVAGNIKSLQVLGGALPGPQGQLASPPAAYTGTQIAALDVAGSVTSSILAAGLDPVDGVLLNSDDTLLSAGAIQFVRIGGALSTDSRVLAATLPDSVSVNGQKIATANDPRFRL